MDVDEAIRVAQISIDIERQNGSDPTAYDLLRICEQLLIAIMLLREKLPREQ